MAHISLSPLFSFSITLLISLTQSQQTPITPKSIDPSNYYNLSAPSTCNNVLIKYPFSPPTPCHLSPFISSCPNNRYFPIASPGRVATFKSLSINYTHPRYISFFRAPSTQFTCGSQISTVNYKVPNAIFSIPANYITATHFNCTAPIPPGLIPGLQTAPCLGCDGQDTSNICYYAPAVLLTATNCETLDIYSRGPSFNASGVGNLREYLQLGYELKYSKPINCRGCENTGGRCGASPLSGSFLCFCPSSVNRINCTEGMVEDISIRANWTRKKGPLRIRSVVARKFNFMYMVLFFHSFIYISVTILIICSIKSSV